MRFIITGFGPFGSVKVNPSAQTAEKAAEKLAESGIQCDFKQLVASINSVDRFYNELPDGSDIFVVHIGVDAASRQMVIERYGRNIIDFPIPDAEGAQPTATRIDVKMGLDQKIENKINIPELVDQLHGAFSVSEDAGSYVCNYSFFKGLSAVGTKVTGCVFVHVPMFSRVDLEAQTKNIVDLVTILNKQFTH